MTTKSISINDATDQILALPVRGSHSHNIVSLILRQVAEEHGKGAANGIIRALDLEATYGIKPVEEQAQEGQPQ